MAFNLFANTKPSQVVNGIGGYQSRDDRTNTLRGTITHEGDFIPAYPLNTATKTSRQPQVITPARAFQDGYDAGLPPAYQFGGSNAQERLEERKGVNW